jgi:hypothetical protein
LNFDPRDYDDARDNDESGRRNEGRSHGHDDDDARTLGQGPSSDRQTSGEHGHNRRDDARWAERGRDERQRGSDGRNVFTRHVRLPRRREREIVRDRDREYTLRGSESRTLVTVGAFRVVSSRDLGDASGKSADCRSGDLRHLREQGLIETARVPGYRDHAVTLTKAGRHLLETHRHLDRHVDRHPDRSIDRHQPQKFYSGLVREREREHDLQVYRAYEQAAARLQERGAHVDRVVLDHELKSEYQRWLHEHDGDRSDYDGHADRTPDEVREWAAEHDLPYFDDEVHFPDLRIEYQEPDGRWQREDIEVVTSHYRGAHGASVARSGFSCYRGAGVSISGRSGGNRGGAQNGGLAEELWR